MAPLTSFVLPLLLLTNAVPTFTQRLRSHVLFPELSPLLLNIRQSSDNCLTDQVECNDGSGGCCDTADQCDVTSDGLGICNISDCVGGTICTGGALDGICCEAGYKCDYVNLDCTTDDSSLEPTIGAGGGASSNTASITLSPSTATRSAAAAVQTTTGGQMRLLPSAVPAMIGGAVMLAIL